MELKFTKAVKARWVAALRSDDYIQTKHRLKKVEEHEVRYCCLGVLAEVCQAWPEIQSKEVLLRIKDEEFEYLIRGEHDQAELSTRNDNGESFEKIADYIEANVFAEAD